MRFANIPGHYDLKSKLVNMFKHGRVSHAITFAGEEGSANLSLAIAFAQFISCKNPSEKDSCGICPSCVKYEKHTHPDVHFYFPTTTSGKVPKKPISNLYYEEWREYLLENPFVTHSTWLKKMNPDRKDAIISTDDSSQIIKDLSLKSYESESRFAIIWLPEKFNVFSSNKLLKIIEEPPKNAYFFLATANLELVLPTIISRTLNLRIGKINNDEMSEWLKKNHDDLQDNQLNGIIKSAEGNPLKALKAMEEKLINSELTDYFINWARLCYKAYEKMPDLINCSEDLAKRSRDEQNQILSYGVQFLRNGLLQNNASDSLLYMEEDERKHVKNFAPLLTTENCARIAASFEKTRDHLNRYANAKVLFLDLSIDFARNINVKNVNL